MSLPPQFPEGVSQEVRDIITCALAKEPSARFQSAKVFRETLEDLIEHQSSNRLLEDAEQWMYSLRKPNQADEDGLPILELFKLAQAALDRSLARWPENPRALACREELLGLQVQVAIDAGELERASRLLELMGSPPEKLVQAVATLREVRSIESADLDRLRRGARDQDVQLGLWHRGWIFLVLGVITGLVFIIHQVMWKLVPDAVVGP
jgi:hypothetical protein